MPWFFSSVNGFWIVLNNEAVISMIKNLNRRIKGESINTFDFFTLSTKMQQRKILKVLYNLIDFCQCKIGLPHSYSHAFDKCSVEKTLK